MRGFFAAIASLLNLQLDAVFITLLQYIISGWLLGCFIRLPHIAAEARAAWSFFDNMNPPEVLFAPRVGSFRKQIPHAGFPAWGIAGIRFFHTARRPADMRMQTVTKMVKIEPMWVHTTN